MSRERASDVGFCVVDSNADLIADALVRRLRETVAEVESQANRLYRGRNAYDLTAVAKLDLDKAMKRLNYIADTLHQIQGAQSHIAYLHAAE